MTSDAQVKTLEDLMIIDSGFAFKSSDWVETGTPVIKIRNVQDGYVDLSGCSFVSDETAKKASSWYGEIGNTLIALTGAGVGEIGRIRDKQSGLINQRVGWVRPKSPDEEDYIYYLLRYFKTEIIELASGSAQPNVSPKDILRIPCQVPRKVERVAVGAILSVLDEKIVLNNLISQTLEDIAQTIFRSWIIDFNPVKAKMAGEKPAGMDAATAALFPDSMEESELGLIPKGWEVRSLDEISEYLNGLAMQKFPVTDEDEQLPVIKIAQLRAGNTQGADVASGLLDSRYIIKDGDILFSWSGTLEVETWAGGPGALNQHLFKVSGKTVPDWYSYLSTKGFLPFFREIASGKATTMGHIQRGHLSESKLAIPNLELLNRATEIIEPLISLKIKTSIESRNLVEIRDSLLPRLISGELQIPEEMLAS
jgi:type I restriction enzyme, S subunit